MSDTMPSDRPEQPPSSPPEPVPRREPAFNVPGVVLACCLVLLAIHGLRALLSESADDSILALLAFVPARLAIALGIARHALEVAVQNMPQDMFRALIGDGGAHWWTLVSYAFLHGSWAHVGLNCIWLAAFGAPVARRFGTWRFLLLLMVAAIFGALVQFAWSPASFIPVIGASAAVAGAMGAAARFVFRPNDESTRIFARDRLNDAFRLPALSLSQTLRTKGALFFVLFWFGTNLVFGLFPSLSGVGSGPIAWQAHIGGFLAGLLMFPLFDPAPDVTESAESSVDG